MKIHLVVIFSIVLAATVLFLTIKHYEKTYKVEIEFCDGRPSVITTVKSTYVPSRTDINNIKRAVPEYKGYLNVCDLKVVN